MVTQIKIGMYIIFMNIILTFIMQEVQSKANLGCIETCMFFWKPTLPLHMEHEISSSNKFNDKEESAWRLEARMQPHQEGVV